MRQPNTQKELAAHLNVCPDTPSHWKKDPDLKPLLNALKPALGAQGRLVLISTANKESQASTLKASEGAHDDLAMAFINALAGLKWPGYQKYPGEGVSRNIHVPDPLDNLSW